MMSNSRAKPVGANALAVSIASLILTACAVALPPASDGPAPARPDVIERPPITRPAPHRVEIDHVELAPIAVDDPLVVRIVHHDDYATLRAPLRILVALARPLEHLERTASPVIVINGEVLSNTVVLRDGADQVVAIIPDGTALGRRINVQVGWLGDFGRTLSSPVAVTTPEVSAQ